MMSKNNLACTSNSRRNLLKGSITAASAGLVSAQLASVSASAAESSPKTRPFVERLPVYAPKTTVPELSPPAQAVAMGEECGRQDHQRWAEFYASKFYELHVRENMHSFHPDLPIQPIWGYDGIFPGPTFVAKYGEPVIVRIYNELPQNHVGYGSPEISTHLHNLHNASESDGFTGDYYSALKFGPTMSAPGKYKDHLYANCLAGYDEYHETHGDPREALGTLWYHDHRLDFTAPNVHRGLSGFYLLFDDIDSGNEYDTNPKALRLPSGVGKYDIPLVFHDKQFNAKGIMAFDSFNSDGILGDKFCINGKIQPYFEVERRKYRFRLLDGGPSRFYEFYLSYDGKDQSFTYIANDGNLLEAPLVMKKVRLSPAERADIVIDFAAFPIGAQVFLVNKLEQTSGRGPTGQILSGTQLLRFDVKANPPVDDASRVPDKLREQPPLPTADELKSMPKRVWEFDRGNGGWTVNGKLFNVKQVAAKPRLGTQELWILRGKGNWSHPIHIHFEEGRILSRNGKAPPIHERGRKDVYVIGPGEELRLVMKFRDYTGKYMMHCHNLTHEDHAMMVRWDIVT
ncbi:multicopper oxidase family protein [Telluria aromaticivorans]|uniref:Multicopper oxidase CueO n=1 Tax=Telluria aromaticivorans TaxID=2725995 RepID=A0A7Y2P0I1_9BURK|nr:multicopper oxidase domain-containing protein [Telluria aromaticivorans]NNG23561.1 multicopper oxidase domain-containing protein [Telluria aromaticivorans]